MAEEVEGLKELNKALDLFCKYLAEEVADAIQWGMDQIVKTAQASDAFTDHTTNLRNSIRNDLQILADQVLGTVKAGGPDGYAEYVEFGTGPLGQETNKNTEVDVTYSPAGRREAKEAEALHWVNAAGEDQFFKSIWWHGTKAHPFLYPAYTEWKDKIIAKIEEAPERAARRAGLL